MAAGLVLLALRLGGPVPSAEPSRPDARVAGGLRVAAPLARVSRPSPAAPIRGADSGAEAEVRLAEARGALNRGDLAAALRACRTARLAGAPARAVLPVEAEIFKEAGYLDRESHTLSQWAAAAPNDATPWLKLFYIDRDLGWRHEAQEAVKRAAALAPQDPHMLVARAIWQERSPNAARALPFVDQAMRLNPTNGELASLRATILLKMGRNAEAESVLRQALARDPASAPDRLSLAHALLVQGKEEEAIAQLREVERREPGSVEAAYQLGVLAEKQGQVAEAVRELERAAAADAGFSSVLWHLGRLYLRLGRREEGRKLLQLFQNMDANTSAFETTLAQLEIRPDDAALHERLARFHLQAGELPQAIVELRRVVELRRGDPAARRALAAALTRQGRMTEARRLVAGLPLP